MLDQSILPRIYCFIDKLRDSGVNVERIWQGDSTKSRCHDASPCIGRLSAKLCMEKITVRKITSYENTVYQCACVCLQTPSLL